MSAPVEAARRFHSKRNPCPVCGGGDDLPRDQGKRCHGFLSSDGGYAHCSREEQAGGLDLDPDSQTYAHRLAGPCRCGQAHGVVPAPPPRANGDRPRILAQSDFDRCVHPYPVDYRDETGAVLFRVCRWPRQNGDKTYGYAHLNGGGTWIARRPKGPPMLYRLPEIRAAIAAGERLWITEGEKCAHTLLALGLVATTNEGGAHRPWTGEHTAALAGARSVVILADADDVGRRHAADVAASLVAAGVPDVRLLELPGLSDGEDVADWVARHEAGSISEVRAVLEALASAAPEWTPPANPAPAAPHSLEEVVNVFRRWLHLPDRGPLLALLAAVAANRMPGDPVWLLMVAPPSSGKTELLESLRGLPGVHPAATITEPALLSGTPSKERARDAKGGLLRAIGESGIILCKDFGSVLSMNRDARAGVLAALREVFDGSWVRHVGTDGGRTLSWSGHVGFIGGCPPAIDRHHGVMASLGERFLLLRLAECEPGEPARRALGHAGREPAMRRELAGAVIAFFTGLRLPQEPLLIAERETDYLVRLATLVSRCRSAVERDGYTREVELVPGAESPARLAVTLKRLHDGLAAIGADMSTRWRIVRRVALDSMPALRRQALEVVARMGEPDTTAVATGLTYPTSTSRRVLEDLAAYGVVVRTPQGSGKADKWRVGQWLTEDFLTLPEMSEGTRKEGDGVEDTTESTPILLPVPAYDDISGKVPSSPVAAFLADQAGGAP